MKPIIYKVTLATRMSDLDVYGHVNANVYTDLVNSSRLRYLEMNLKLSAVAMIKQGFGFYLRRTEVDFLRPIVGFTDVSVSSWVKEQEDSRVLIEFKISSADEQTTYSKGLFHYVVIDVRTQKPITLPDSLKPYLFEAGE